MTRLLISALLCWPLAAGAAGTGVSAGAAEETVSKIYEVGKTEGPPLFIQHTRVQANPDGSQTETATIEDQSGATVMTEKARLRRTDVLDQSVEQRQTEEAYELSRENGKVIFRTFSLKNGERKLTEESSEKLEPDFVTGPSVQAYVESHWQKLHAGEEQEIHFGVFEIGKSVAFDLEKKDGPSGQMLVRMSPSSFLIGMFVSPIFLTFDSTSKKLIHFRGRTPLKKKEGSKWKPFDAEITYETKSGS